jgi:hypothetical protein
LVLSGWRTVGVKYIKNQSKEFDSEQEKEQKATNRAKVKVEGLKKMLGFNK